MSAPGFASANDLEEKKISFDEIGSGLYAFTAEGERKSATMTSSWSNIPFDKVSDFNPLDRCITRGLPASMFPFMYNSGIEIMQAPGYVVIRLELIHETRIVPVDGRPPLNGEIRQWLGESRGRWDGDTLVIDTTNFNGESPMTIVGPGGKPMPTSERVTIRKTSGEMLAPAAVRASSSCLSCSRRAAISRPKRTTSGSTTYCM